MSGLAEIEFVGGPKDGETFYGAALPEYAVPMPPRVRHKGKAYWSDPADPENLTLPLSGHYVRERREGKIIFYVWRPL